MKQKLQVTISDLVEMSNSEALLLFCEKRDQKKKSKRKIEEKFIKYIDRYGEAQHCDPTAKKNYC